ncbi:TIGR04222 domain-containing membrane protein [Amycolatopsis orientalis]|uniref:TIGR04222 domain-containing membrane protein n=1 Tax=Amycolatopsis orientalis TaxID=31958 RepID=UPI00039C87C7|nr:TIGR04222 domain-containing membrane protein [Amycolatopsis orientalis]
MNGFWAVLSPMLLVYAAMAAGLVSIVATGKDKLAKQASAPESAAVPRDVYDVAYLAGGRPRAVEAAIAALLARGQLQVGSYGEIIAAGSPPASPLEQAVHQAAGRGRLASWVARSSVVKPAIRTLETDLVQRRLVSRRRPLTGLGYTLTTVAVVVLAAGVARLAYDVGRSHLNPMVLLAFAAVVLTLWLCLVASQRITKTFGERKVSSLPPTTAGATVVARAEQQAATGSGTGPAELVAVGGLAAYPDKRIAGGLIPV